MTDAKFEPSAQAGAGDTPLYDAAREAHDIDVLARTIWGEARGESVRGMEAVAAVVLNRARISQEHGGFWWGSGVAGVCQKPFQFSCWNPDDPNRAKLLSVGESDAQFRIARRIAARAVRGALADPTNGADHYHTRTVSPAWSLGKAPVAEIGGHLFFRLVAPRRRRSRLPGGAA